MKTGELFVEPVLIGFAVLVTVALLGVPGLPQLERWMLNADFEKVAVVVPAAYFAGIVFDRIADTLLGHLEQHHRLQFALGELDKPRNDRVDDPFPEDRYHINLMGTDQAWEHAYYLRSRIRITRALIVLTPAFGVAALFRIAQESPRIHWLGIACVGTVYLVALYARTRDRHRITPKRLLQDPAGRFALPRTDGLLNGEIRAWYTKKSMKVSPLGRFVLRNEPMAWGVFLIAGVSVVVGVRGHVWKLGVLSGAAIVFFSSVFTWCWWRISETFYTFLRNYSAAKLSG